jgi:hypothetical protein
LHREKVEARLFSVGATTTTSTKQQSEWFTRLRHSYNQALLLDRHFMCDVERHVCIASLPEQQRFSTVESHRVYLADKFQHRLKLRELPVSLLRLFFSGKQHFQQILDRVPNDRFKHLYGLYLKDASNIDDGELVFTDGDVEEDQQTYSRKMARLKQMLALVADYAFCSFERTLQKLMALLDGRDKEWYHLGLFEAIQQDGWWRNMPLPPHFICYGDMSSHLVWYAAVWRTHAARIFDTVVQPWHDNESQQWFLYRSQLYRDTHLELLSAMVTNQCYSDKEVHEARLLRTHYPTSNRVVCAEELPDLTPYSMDNFKTGPHLKERNTLSDKMGHYSCIKTFNNICKDRNWWDIVRTYGEQHPIVYDHIKMCIKAVLLGNLPGSLGSLDLMARIRITVSFWPEYADRPLTEEEVGQCMPDYCNPFIVARQKRAAKLAKENAKNISQAKRDQNMALFDVKENAKMAYVKTPLKMLMIRCPRTCSSMMKEVQFYTQESGRCVDEFLSIDLMWAQFKNITRIANGQVRLELSQQAATLPLTQPFDWRQIEFIEKSHDGRYDVKSGKIMAFHNIALKVARKVMKRNFNGIIEIKSTGIEEKISLDKNTPLPQVYYDPNDPAHKHLAGKLPTLDELLFLLYCLGVDESPVPKTAILQAMGVSKQGLAWYRDWLVEYYLYGYPDDSYKKKILRFAKHSLADYVLIKMSFKGTTIMKRADHIFYLSEPIALRQANALRKHHAKVSDWDPTPPLLGVHYQCYGCGKFANAVVVPTDYPMRSTYAEFTYQRHRIYNNLPQQALLACDQNLVLITDSRQVCVLERYKDCFARLGLNANKVPVSAKKTQQQEKNKANKKKKTREDEEKKKLKKNDNVSFLNIAAYGIADAKPYCVRNKRKRITGAVNFIDNERNVIMRSRNGEITVYCNKVATRVESTAEQQGDDTDGAGDSDDEEGSGDEGGAARSQNAHDDRQISTGGGENGDIDENSPVVHITRPEYEEDAALLTTNINSLNSRDLARLHRYAVQHTQDLITTPASNNNASDSNKQGDGKKKPAATENNKKRIHRAVMEPLHKRYNCDVPMQAIDMVGIVKNGMVLCVECGAMTQYRNHNMTSQGPTCMRHRQASMMRSHHAWNAPNVLSVESIIESATATSTSTHSGDKMDNTKKKQLHRHLFVPDYVREQCACCHQERARLSLTLYNARFLLYQVLVCFGCHAQVKARHAGKQRVQVYQVSDAEAYFANIRQAKQTL